MNGAPSVTINLAREPFRRERAQIAAYALLCTALLVLLALLSLLFLRQRAQAADLRTTINAQQAELARLQRESTQASNLLSRPRNADVFARSVFWNEVISRRSVSWTIVFRDLEKLLPPNIKLIGVRLPQLGTQGTELKTGGTAGLNLVQLDMVLGADRPEALIELLKRLAVSDLFGPAKLLGQQPPNQNDPTYKFRVTVPYAQKL